MLHSVEPHSVLFGNSLSLSCSSLPPFPLSPQPLSSDNILDKIKEAGFQVSLTKETHLTKEMAEQLYSQQKGKEFYNDLTNIMSR